MLRLTIAGALLAAVLALPSIGRFLARRRLARLFAVLIGTAVIFIVAQYGQRSTDIPTWALAAIRLQMTAVMLWVPICLGLLREATGEPVPRAAMVVTAALAALPWVGELLLENHTYLRSHPDGHTLLAAKSGPLFPVVALYGLMMLGYIGIRLWRADRPQNLDVRRWVVLALGVLILALLNDILLVLGVAATVSVTDLGIAVSALLLVASLQAGAADKQAALEQYSAEKVEDLRATQQELEAALDNTLNVITALPDTIMLHRDGQLEFINPAGKQWLGLEDDALGTPLDALLAPRKEGSMASPLLEDDPPATSFEERFVSRDGRPLIGEVRALAIMHDGLPMQMAIVRDLTARREIEQKLLTADRLSSLGTLAAGVGHEINNPLTYISTNLALARKETKTEGIREMLDDAYEGVQRVARIVEGLNTFARRRRSTDTQIDIRRAIDTAVKLVGHQVRHRANFVVDVDDALPRVAGSEDDIIQVLVNILINASHAIEEAPRREHSITVTARHRDSYLVVTVDDTGTGIPASHQNRLLEPFFTTKPVGKGTGLGLSICHGIIKGLRGELTLENREVGARAQILLPLLASPASDPTALAENPTPRSAISKGMRILVIDDDPMVRRSLRRLLAQHDVAVASDGERGLEACAAQSYDLVLCDVMMPGISGTEVLTHLAKDNPAQAERVVLITGGVFAADERKRVDALGARVLQKPITPEQLDETLARHASSPAMSAE